jgi:hypothetical protein
MSQEFTFKEAFELQHQHIKRWYKILKPEAYLQLLDIVIEKNNNGYNSPYEVCRGVDITNIVCDLLND